MGDILEPVLNPVLVGRQELSQELFFRELLGVGRLELIKTVERLVCKVVAVHSDVHLRAVERAGAGETSPAVKNQREDGGGKDGKAQQNGDDGEQDALLLR